MEGVTNGGGGGGPGGGGGVVKANKGMILRKSVEYIRYLQQLVTAQGARNRELEAELKAYRTAADGERKDGGVDSGESDAGQSRPTTCTSSAPTSPPELGSDGELNGMILHDEAGPVHVHAHGHRHGHGHVRGTSANGYGSFGGLFRLPSMPEGGESEDGGDEEGIEEGGEHDLVYTGVEAMDGVEEDEARERGRTRLKSLGHVGKIKEEQDAISMET